MLCGFFKGPRFSFCSDSDPWRCQAPPPRWSSRSLVSYAQSFCILNFIFWVCFAVRYSCRPCYCNFFRKEQIIPTESSQPNEQNAAQNENSAHRLRHSKSMPKLKSLSLAVVPTALAGLLFAPAATASVVATAETTSASPQFQHLYHMVDDKTMYLGCVALGGTFAILTIVSTGRFIMSL